MRTFAVLIAVGAVGCGDDGPSGNVDPEAQPADIDKLVRACAVADTCAYLGIDRCVMSLFVRGTNAQVDCLLAAGVANCAAANACIGIKQRSVDASCVPACLDAQTVVTCSGNLRSEIDCAAYFESTGPQCVNGTTPSCGVGTCTAEGAITCSGTVVNSCDGGVMKTSDCAVYDMECVERNPPCVPPASGSCNVFPECDGDFLVACDDQAIMRRTDCGAILPGGTCVVIGNSIGCGLAAECAPGSSPAVCIGTTLRSCISGAIKDVDCTSIGGTCTSGAAAYQCAP